MYFLIAINRNGEEVQVHSEAASHHVRAAQKGDHTRVRAGRPARASKVVQERRGDNGAMDSQVVQIFWPLYRN